MVGRKTFFLFHFGMWDLFSGAIGVSFREGNHRFGSTPETQDAIIVETPRMTAGILRIGNPNQLNLHFGTMAWLGPGGRFKS